jgi:hypothetical protein
LTEDKIDLLMFQFDERGGGFIIEISQCPAEGILWGDTLVPPNKVAVPYTKFVDRHRLGVKDNNDDHWFRYDTTSSESRFDQVANSVIPFLDEAEFWWASRRS